MYNTDVIARSLLRTSVKTTPSTNNVTTLDAGIFHADSVDEGKINEDYLMTYAAKNDAVNEVCSANISSISNKTKSKHSVNNTELTYTTANTNDINNSYSYVNSANDDIESVIKTNANLR